MTSYGRSGRYYDSLYADKDYRGEVAHLLERLEGKAVGGRLLDLGCGTGRHLEHLLEHFECHGLDLQPELLEVARRRLSATPLYEGDMADFSAPGPFDLLTCFFGSVGYLGSQERLTQAATHWADLLKPGGWLALETWIQPEEFRAGRVMATFVDEPDFKLTRMAVSCATGTLYDTDFHYLLATPQGVEHFSERHQLRMYTHAEYRSALEGAGFVCNWEPDLGIRGMYLGQLA
ncbi:class I SAM-dependent methyltransferase [bacterium]|nr:class I SAM-dependent methyltransferase [bacterium]